MALFAVVGDKLATLEQLDTEAQSSGSAVLAVEAGQPAPSVALRNGPMLSPADLQATVDAQDDRVAFVGIGTGKPLTMSLEQVYLGEYPDTVRFIPGDQRGDALVTSAHKAFEIFGKAPRAVHLLQKHAARKQHLRAKATQDGSQLVYYSPAITDVSLLFTFEISVDRNYSDEFGKSLGQAFSAAGALPVFATTAPYLIAAGVAIPIATKAANLLARPQTYFESTIEVNFSRPGLKMFQAGAFVIVPDGHGDELKDYTLNPDNYALRDGNGKDYNGDVPYIVVSLDGTDRPQFKQWKEQAASAALTEQFFGGDGALSAALSVVSESLSLYNDIHFQQQASDLKKQIKATKDPTVLKELQTLYDAAVKNISNSAISASAK